MTIGWGLPFDLSVGRATIACVSKAVARATKRKEGPDEVSYPHRHRRARKEERGLRPGRGHGRGKGGDAAGGARACLLYTSDAADD